MGRRWSRWLTLVLAATLVAPLAGCERGEDPGPDPAEAVRLTFGVFGSAPEVAPFRAVVESFNDTAVSIQVDLVTWPDSDALIDDLESGVDPPDVYLTARRDLAGVVEGQRNAPLFDLLEARNISYGDAYAQQAIEAFSADDDLQCMPYSVSPLVIYYNTDLIDFERMDQRGLPVPEDELEGWTFEQFAAAAAFASRRGATRGISVEPRLRSLAPFLFSGGGELYDDTADPRSLVFAADDNVDTLATVLALLRDPEVTLSPEQLEEASPQEWFERGRLAMIEGYRSLTPELRTVEGLDFDVMPMPSLGESATVGDITGLCIAPGDHVQQAADFLVHAISEEGVTPVAEAGYVVPANLGVGRSEAFLQSDEQPEHAGVFNASVESLVVLPIDDDTDGLDEVVDPLLDEMLNGEPIDLPELTARIDEASRSVLDPDYVPTPPESTS